MSALKALEGGINNLLKNPLLINLLAQQGYSDTPQSPLGALGKGMMMTQQQERQKQLDALQKQLIESEIFKNTMPPYQSQSGFLQELAAENAYRRAHGMEEISPEDWARIKNPGARLVTLADGTVLGVDPRGFDRTPIVSPDEARLATTRDMNTKAQFELEEALEADNEFLDKGERYISLLESGELNTGPFIGMFPAVTTNAQLFRSFAGENIIQSISKATFGQLSEGERKFIATTNPGRGLTEEANIDIIKTKIKYIRRAQDRARRRLGQSPITNDAPPEDKPIEEYTEEELRKIAGQETVSGDNT